MVMLLVFFVTVGCHDASDIPDRGDGVARPRVDVAFNPPPDEIPGGRSDGPVGKRALLNGTDRKMAQPGDVRSQPHTRRHRDHAKAHHDSRQRFKCRVTLFRKAADANYRWMSRSRCRMSLDELPTNSR